MTLYIGDKPVGLFRVVKDTKYISKTKLGVTIDALLGSVDENGAYTGPTESFELDFSGVKTIGSRAAPNLFNTNKAIVGVNLSSVEKIEFLGLGGTFSNTTNLIVFLDLGSLEVVEESGLEEAFYFSGVTGANLSKIKTIGSDGLRETFHDCSNFGGHVDLGALTTIASSSLNGTFWGTSVTSADIHLLEAASEISAMSYTFYGTKITTIDLSSLKTVGYSSMQYTFKNSKLEKISFPSLVSTSSNSFGTTSTNSTFNGCSYLTEIHFRADAQSTIESMSQYSSKWGAYNATIYFDLIGTITVNGVAYSRNEPNSIRVDGTKTHVAWADESGNIIYTDATSEPAFGTAVYSDAGTTQAGTVEGVA